MNQLNASVLTADQSRAARLELSLSQKDVIEQAGIPAYKIKQFESSRAPIDRDTRKKLREFYEQQGVNFEVLDAQLSSLHNDGGQVSPSPARVGSSASKAAGQVDERLGFLISRDLPGSVIDKLQTDMNDSDDRIGEIVKAGLKKGLFGDLSSESEGLIQELFAHMAMNYLRFRCLNGRNIIEATRDEAKTVGDYLAQWVQGQGVVLIGDKQPESKQTRNGRQQSQGNQVGKEQHREDAAGTSDQQPETIEQE